jgi:hypothetical protein
MSYNWGPHYIVPSKILKTYSGSILLREELSEDLLRKELEGLGLAGGIVRINNPWYYRKKNTDTWIMIGESEDIHGDFPVRWDTTVLENGQYEVKGLMHVFVKQRGEVKAIARENMGKVDVRN